MIKRKRFIAGALIAAMSLTMLAGCGAKDSTDSGSQAGGDGSVAAEAGSTGPKEIVVDTQSEPPELNPILNSSTGGGNVLRHIMEGLTYLNPDNTPHPAMAESWDISDDKMTYTFHIRKDAKWTNGEPVTAHDFVFSWNTLFTPATAAQYASTWAPMIEGGSEILNSTSETELATAIENAGYKAVDDYTFEVKLTAPYPYFLSVLSFYSFMPLNEKAYNEIGGDNYAKEYDAMVTNGPWKMTGWIHESEITLEKNPDYYDKDSIKVDKITMVMINDSNARMNSFKAEEVDMIDLTGDQVKAMEAEGKTVLGWDDGSAWYFEFQVSRPGMNNQKIREAMTLAIDAESFIDNVLKNSSKPTYSFTPGTVAQGKFAEKVGKVLDRPTGDYSAVKALFEEGLAEEGLTIDTFKPVIITDDTDQAAKNCAFFQEQWRQNLGLNVEVQQMPYKSRLARQQAHDFDIVMAGWSADYDDPMSYLDIWQTGGGNNHTTWSNPEYDQLIKDAIVEADADKRDQMLMDAESILLTEFPIGPIYNRHKDYICSDRLTGVVRTAFINMGLRWTDVVE